METHLLKSIYRARSSCLYSTIDVGRL